MAILKCKMCGGQLDIQDGQTVIECVYCGTKQTVPTLDNEKKLNLFNRANRLRMANEFDKAAGVYETIVAEFPEEAEAYWGLVLCKYGIEYVDDSKTGKKIPTCHRTSFESIFDDSNFEMVMRNADAVARVVYREEAKVIEEIRKEGVYKKASALLNEKTLKSMKEAITLFTDLGDYKDSKDQIIETKYQYAVKLIDDNKYKEAKVILKEIYEYKDSAEKIEECDIIIYARFKDAQVGDVITFGSYEQDNNLNNGQEDIEWIVLEKEGSKILVISKYGLDCKPYNTEDTSVTWETCTLRKWLNDDFVTTAFTTYEKGMIPTVTVSADKNPYYSTTPGNSTQDQVFLLSIKEAYKYFSFDDQRKCQPTEYAVANGARESYDGDCWWWLRSPGYDQSSAAYVLTYGTIGEYGFYVYGSEIAVRPALWINLDAYIEGHKDSKDKIIETKYQYAVKLIDDKKYKEAKVILKEIHEYKDSAEKIEECDINIYAGIKAAQVGDVITFGSYEQDNDLNYGQEDIEWIVLEKVGSYILVISKYGLDCKPYNTEDTSVTWETCTLRKWLNDDFVTTAFTAYEKGMIPTLTVSADENPYSYYSTTSGNSTQDQVFLLSIKEANKYFSSDDQRKCQPTKYAVANGARESYDGDCWWWLRSPGRRQDSAAGVSARGNFSRYVFGVYGSELAVRPALWINLDAYIEGHKDSKDQIIETKYQYAVKLIDDKKYKEAKVILKEIYEYKDSAEKIEECDINIYAGFKDAQVGDVITFGSYEQDNNLINGKEDIEWIVLEKEGSKILVISKYALDSKPYNIKYTSVTWETCTLREWLNDDFVTTAFTTYEKGMIPTVTVSDDKNPGYSTTPGNSTQDQVFLLSIKEANKYFSSADQRKCQPTKYAVANGAFKSYDGDCWWWLRSPGRRQDKAAGVSARGNFNGYVFDVYGSEFAVRPALWINLDS